MYPSLSSPHHETIYSLHLDSAISFHVPQFPTSKICNLMFILLLQRRDAVSSLVAFQGLDSGVMSLADVVCGGALYDKLGAFNLCLTWLH